MTFPSLYICKILQDLRIMETCRREGGEIIEQEDREFAVKLCFPVTSELYQQSLTNMTIQMWAQQGWHKWICQTRLVKLTRPQPTKRTIGNWGRWKRVDSLQQGSCAPIGCTVPKCQLLRHIKRHYYIDWPHYI